MLTNLAIWFAALGALNIGIGTYSYKEKSISLGCVFCITSLILGLVDIFV